MSYQSYLQSIHRPEKSASTTPSISRKPAPQTPSTVPNSVANTNSPNSTNVPITPVSRTSTNLSSVHTSALPTHERTPASPSRSPLTQSQIDAALTSCLFVQTTAVNQHNKRPFAALLLAPDNNTTLLTHFSISHVQHAENELARLASIHFSQEYLAACTLVSTWEPCAMCTGTIYWTNIGRICYAASETKLKELTGGNNDENMTMSLPCREVLKHGQKDIEVVGPVPDWAEKVVEESGKWWRHHQPEIGAGSNKGSSLNRTKNNNGDHPNSRHPSMSSQNTPTTWAGEESGWTNDEGEYKADLKIDWMG